jgi:hypothetical protein
MVSAKWRTSSAVKKTCSSRGDLGRSILTQGLTLTRPIRTPREIALRKTALEVRSPEIARNRLPTTAGRSRRRTRSGR